MTRRRSSTPDARSKVQCSWTIDPAIDGPHASRGLITPETIASCIELGITRGRLRMVQSALPKGAEIVSIAGRLIRSSDYAIEFSLHLRTRGGRRPFAFRIVVARNERERADTVKAEIKNLQWLAPRLPKNTAPIISFGTVFQPDRHGRAESHREMPAYLTKPIPRANRCSIGNAEQLAAGEPAARLLTRADTDHVRRGVIELCLSAYDPESRKALPPPDVERGALCMADAGRGRTSLWITGCPTLWDRIDAVTLTHRLAGFEWRRGNLVLPLLPSTPDQLLEATTAALGKSTGRELLANYLAALDSGRFPEHRRLTRETLRALLGESAS